MAITLCTFNVNNLFLRYKFGKTFPGDMSNKSETEDYRWGYLPLYKPGLFETFGPEQRELSAKALRLDDGKLPDILCVQEVESMHALRAFNEHYFGDFYPYALLVDCRDLRQIDVGVLSRYPLVKARSFVDLPDDRDKDFPWLFSRDCFEVTVSLNKSSSRELTLFINHFKSKLVIENDPTKRAKKIEAARKKRERQARQVVRILKERFPDAEYGRALFAVVGDLNDEPRSPAVKHLVDVGELENVLERLPADERWTHYFKSKGQVSQFDYILASPALSRITMGISPEVQRRGIGFRARSQKDGKLLLPARVTLVAEEEDPNPIRLDFQFKRFKDVSESLVASDHCPVTLRIPV
jgi:endonuclease/exonuclease/phosphatase family metal-dependent hydrolase